MHSVFICLEIASESVYIYIYTIEKQTMLPNGCPSAVSSHGHPQVNKRYNPPKMKFDTKIWHPNISSQAWPS